MMQPTDRYAWLLRENGPKMLMEALKLYGTKETEGDGNNPDILAWAKEVNAHGYAADSVPWCGLFVALCAKRAGKKIPENPLWARNWCAWGDPSPKELGAILVFSRGSGGHVALYVGEDKECYHVLGGNQGDSVSIVRIRKDRLIGCRSMYNVKPANVRQIWIDSSGIESKNEQ